MALLLESAGGMVFLFILSLGGAYLFSAIGRKTRPKLPEIKAGSSVRLVGPGGVYRCHLVRRDRDGIVLSAPLQRDHYVPIRADECLMVQMPTDVGLVTFRANVMSRDGKDHTLKLSHPTRFRQVDRRAEPRLNSVAGQTVDLNGSNSHLVNLSASGARVLTPLALKAGERIMLKVADGLCYGWALESLPDSMGTKSARNVRLRFESPLEGLPTFRVLPFGGAS